MLTLDTPWFYLPILASVLILVIAQVTYCIYLYFLSQQNKEDKLVQNIENLYKGRSPLVMKDEQIEAHQFEPIYNDFDESSKKVLNSNLKPSPFSENDARKASEHDDQPKISKEIDAEMVKISSDLQVGTRPSISALRNIPYKSSDSIKQPSTENVRKTSANLDTILNSFRLHSELPGRYKYFSKYKLNNNFLFGKPSTFPKRSHFSIDFPNSSRATSPLREHNFYRLRDNPNYAGLLKIPGKKRSRFHLSQIISNTLPSSFVSCEPSNEPISPPRKNAGRFGNEQLINQSIRESSFRSELEDTEVSTPLSGLSEFAAAKSEKSKTSKPAKNVTITSKTDSSKSKTKKESKKASSSQKKETKKVSLQTEEVKTKSLVPKISPNAAEKLIKASELLKNRAESIQILKKCSCHSRCPKSIVHCPQPKYFCIKCIKPSIPCAIPAMPCVPYHSRSTFHSNQP